MTRKVKTRTQTSSLRREQAAITRTRIIEGAAAVFQARGYEGARIEDIASKAGVAVPTIYKVFANKRNLLKASVEAAITGGEAGEVERQAWFRQQLEAPTAEGQLRLVGDIAARHPGAFAHLLQALDLHLGTIREVAIVGPEDERAALVAVVRERLRADVVLATGPGAAQDPDPAVPLLAGRDLVDGRAAAYVCEHFACRRPVTEPDELRALLA